jgi:succinate dehydrogenase / fumarate reductase, cytochrome b subunit
LLRQPVIYPTVIFHTFIIPEVFVSVIDKYFKYSIGKKQVMGLLGLALCAFALVHMTGNFLVFQSAEKFNAYGDFLHHLPAFRLIELSLAGLFIAHIVMGIVLAVQNRSARPVGYVKQRGSGGANISSMTMAFTGTYFILFLIVHLLNIRFAILPYAAPTLDEYSVTAAVFANPVLAVFYVISSFVLGLHSSFQSLGLISRTSSSLLQMTSVAYGIVIALGYSSISIFMLIKHG